MAKLLIKNALIVNEGDIREGYLVIVDGIIESKGYGPYRFDESVFDRVDDLHYAMLLPGVIDTHVHFRDPGLTRKADMSTESEAAVRGGVTSFIDMPNTVPPTVSLQAWEEKMKIAAAKIGSQLCLFSRCHKLKRR